MFEPEAEPSSEPTLGRGVCAACGGLAGDHSVSLEGELLFVVCAGAASTGHGHRPRVCFVIDNEGEPASVDESTSEQDANPFGVGA